MTTPARLRRPLSVSVFAAALLCWSAAPADDGDGMAVPGAEAPPPAVADPVGAPYVPEVKFGLLFHDFLHSNEDSGTVSFNMELVWSDLEYWSFDSSFVEVLLNPVPMIGGTVNTAGGVNTAYAGIAWPWEFDVGVTVTNSFGATLHDGRTDRETAPCPAGFTCSLPGNRYFLMTDEPILGSSFLFRYGLDLAWQFTEAHSVSAFYSHSSNAGLADNNDGIDFVGIRYGVKLGRLFE